MKKLITVAAVLAGLFLAGCDPAEQVLVNKFNIPNIPARMYNCPILKTYPQVANLTDKQVATLIVQLHSNNITCKASLDAIKKFLADAGKTVGN